MTGPVDAPRPAPGDVLELHEDHYKFGAGPLVCRVGAVIARVNLNGRPWWHLRGHCKYGTVATLLDVVPWTERELYVDATVVRPPSRAPGAAEVIRAAARGLAARAP